MVPITNQRKTQRIRAEATCLRQLCVTNHLKTQRLRIRAAIHFGHNSAFWAGSSQIISVPHSVAGTAQPRLAGPPSRCLAYVSAAGSLGTRPREWAVNFLSMRASLQVVWGFQNKHLKRDKARTDRVLMSPPNNGHNAAFAVFSQHGDHRTQIQGRKRKSQRMQESCFKTDTGEVLEEAIKILLLRISRWPS